MSDTEREVIDQLATTGTYVTRDGDGVLRHWNGITHEYVGATDELHACNECNYRAATDPRNIDHLL